MNDAIQKKLELLLTWEDKGFQRGYKRAQAGMAALKKSIMSVVKAAAMIAGAFIGASVALLKFIEKGAQAKSVEESFLGFARAAGMAEDTLQGLRQAVRDTIDDTTLMQTSVMALSGGLDPQRLIQYWEMAKQIADVSSRDTVEVFTALTLAINKAQPRTLEQIGITIRLGEATQAYLEKTGKAAKELTSLDRTMAISMALQEKYEKDFLAVGDVTTRVREKFQQFKTTIENLKSRFFELIASSPAAQEFLEILTTRVQGFMDSLDEDKIDRFVTKFVGLFDRVDGYLDRIDEWKAKIQDFWISWEAPLKGAGAGLLAAKIGGALAAVAVAFGLGGPLAAGIVGVISLLVALGVTAIESFKNMRDEAFNTKTYFEQMRDALEGNIDLSEFSALADKLGLIAEKQEAIIENEEKRTPGGQTPRSIQWAEDIQAEAGGGGPNKFEVLASLQSEANARELETYQAHLTALADLDLYQVQNYLFLQDYKRRESLRNNAILVEATRRGYWAMGEYQTLFFRHGSKMGRTLNAMLMLGFTEAIASYIEMKTEQARIDAAIFAAYAIGALASGDFGRAAAYGSAAARLGLVAGVAMIAAGTVRAYGAERAESMIQENEKYEEGIFSGGDEGTGTRRTASGVVNGRPVIVNIMSKVEIKSGITVFGDSEDGLDEFYGEHIRDNIQDDIETGIISIPG